MMMEHLLSDGDYSKEAFAGALKTLLTGTPESTFILQAYDGEDLKAFLIAVAPPEQNHVFVLQAWSSLEDNETPDRMFLRLCLWTESIGRMELRAESKRSPEAFLRRWNFEIFSNVLSFQIPEDLEGELVKGNHRVLVGKETNDGTGVRRDGDDAGPNLRAEVDLGADKTVVEEGVEGRSGGVPGEGDSGGAVKKAD